MKIFVSAGTASSMKGRVASKDEFKPLEEAAPAHLRIDWLIDLMSTYALAGSPGYGAEMIWLTPAQMVSELGDAEPGITAGRRGFIPMGMCTKGSGDPYFFDMRVPYTDDPPVVRLIHDMAGDDVYPDEGVETIQPSLSSFFAMTCLRPTHFALQTKTPRFTKAMTMHPNNDEIRLSGHDAMEILAEVNLVLISLRNIGDRYLNGGTEYEHQTTRFIDDWTVTSRLAKIRQLLSEKFDRSLAEDDMDDLERAAEGLPYWESPDSSPE